MNQDEQQLDLLKVFYFVFAIAVFVWATLPAGIDAALMLDAALQENVGYVPGGPFFAESPATNDED